MAKKFEPKDLGIQSAPAGFNIPKIKKNRSTAILNYLAPTSRQSQELIREVERTCLDPDLKIRKQWKLNTVHSVNPAPTIETRYREKRVEMKEQGGARLQQEVLGFYVCRDRSLATEISKTGIKANPFVSGCLGDPRHGVYLFRYLDVALLSQRDCRNTCILVFKVLQGRIKQVTLTEMGSSRSVPKEPTPNFDCHLSQSAPRNDENVFLMCNKAQMYVYEYTEEAEPAKYPRQCLPYALLEFSNQGSAKIDSGSGDSKGVSTSAASAGWMSVRRPSVEAGRKVTPDYSGLYSKEQPGFTFPAGQPVPLMSTPVMPPAVEPLSSVSLGPESGTWRSPLECRDDSQPVPLEMASSSRVQSNSLAFTDSGNLLPPSKSSFECNTLAVSSDRLGLHSMATSAAVSRDPRVQHSSGNEPHVHPAGSGTMAPDLTSDVSAGEQQTGAAAPHVMFGHRHWDQRNNQSGIPSFMSQTEPGSGALNPQRDQSEFISRIQFFGPGTSVNDSSDLQQERGGGSDLIPGQSSTFVPSSHGEDDAEGHASMKKLHVPLLDRLPAKSALKKSTPAWPMSSQTDGNKKKKTLSFQDYLKKKKAEAQGLAEGKGTVQTEKPAMSGEEKADVKDSSASSLPEESASAGKKFQGFGKDEFQGCVYYPPEVTEQRKNLTQSAGVGSISTVSDTEERTLKPDRADLDFKDLGSDNCPANPSPGKRDPRLRSLYTSSGYLGKSATKDPDIGDDSNSSSATCGKTALPEPNEDDVKLDKNVGENSDSDVAGKRESLVESSERLSSDSQAVSGDTYHKMTVSQRPKEMGKEFVPQHSESRFVDNHQVLFADLEETENENALSMFLGDVSPTDNHSEHFFGGGESKTVLTSETKETDLKNMPAAVLGLGGLSEAQSPNCKGEVKRDDTKPGVPKEVISAGSMVSQIMSSFKCDDTKTSGSKEVISTSSMVSQIMSALKQGLHGSFKPGGIADTTVRQQKKLLSSPSESLREEGTSVNRADSAGQLVSAAEKLKERLASATADVGWKNETFSPCLDSPRKPESIAESLGSDPSSDKSGSAISSSESELSVAASEASLSPMKNLTNSLAEPDKTPKSAGGKGQKSESRRKSKPTEPEGLDSDVDYALLRLAKGLRPGRSIYVGGLGKNPTDDPLPVLEGKRRRKKAQRQSSTKTDGPVQETKGGAPKAAPAKKEKKTQKTASEQQKSQSAGKKTRKKRKSILGTGKKKKKPVPVQSASPPNEEDIDYTDFQFEEPQEFCVSICDDMESLDSSNSGYPAADIAVKVEPAEEFMPGSEVSGDVGVAVKTEPGVEASAGDYGTALPLSSLGLLHWTEALLQPSLNPQVALVDFFKACTGQADFDNCEICQKVIDLKMIEEEEQAAEKTQTLVAEGTAEHNACGTSHRQHQSVSPVLSEEARSQPLQEKEKQPAGDVSTDAGKMAVCDSTSEDQSLGDRSLERNTKTSHEDDDSSSNSNIQTAKGEALLEIAAGKCEYQTVAKPSSVLSDNMEVSKKESSKQHPVLSSPLKLSLATDPPVTESRNVESDHRTEGRAHTAALSGAVKEVEMSNNSIQGSSDTGMSRPSVGPPALPDLKESAESSVLKVGSGSPQQLHGMPEESVASHQQAGAKVRGGVQPLSKSLFPFGSPAARFPRPRPAFSVCSQGSTKQNWQRWKSSQAQQMQQKTSSTVERDAGKGEQESSENSDHTCAKSSEQTVSSELNSSSEQAVHSDVDSSASMERRKKQSLPDSGFWLGISELTSLHRLQKDSSEKEDASEIYSRSVFKISPTKLSQLVPGKEKPPLEKVSPAFSSEVAGFGNASPQSCVASVESEQGNNKMQDNASACKEAGASLSTNLTAHSEKECSVDVENKTSESVVISKHMSDRKPSDHRQQSDARGELFPDSLKKLAQEIKEVSEIPSQHSALIPVRCGGSISTEHMNIKKGSNCTTSSSGMTESGRQSAVESWCSGSPGVTTAGKSGEESKVDLPPCSMKQTEKSALLKQIPGMAKHSEIFSAVQQAKEERNSVSNQLETTSSVSRNLDLFDNVIKDIGQVKKQSHSCGIPGLDLVASQKAEGDIPSRSTESQGTIENADVFCGQSQQSEKVHAVSQCQEGEHATPDTEQSDTAWRHRNTESRESQSKDDRDYVGLQNQEPHLAPSSYKELDVVGTFRSLQQNQRKGGIKLNTFSVMKALKNKDASRDNEKSNTGAIQSVESSGVGKKLDGNVSETDTEEDGKRDQMSGCPIPSLTGVRAKQKNDRRENKKQLDVHKGSAMENQRNFSSENSRPTFQQAVYKQPPLLGVGTDSDPKVTNSGSLYSNPPPSQCYSELRYPPPVHPQPMAVNRGFHPSVPVMMPSMPVFSIPGPPATDHTAVCNSSSVVISEPHRSMLNQGRQHVPFGPPTVSPLYSNLPPPLASVPSFPHQLSHPVTEVSSVQVSAPQIIGAAPNQVCVTAADSSLDSAPLLQTTAPSVTSSSTVTTQSAGEESRCDSGAKAEIDVISWFSKREAAERNPPKKDVIDWFSDIIDKKKGSSVMDLEPEVKKAKYEFMESLKHKKSMYESKDKVESSSKINRRSPCDSGDAGKTSSNNSRKSACHSEESKKTSLSKTSGKSVCESRDAEKKGSQSLKRQNSSGSSQDTSKSNKKPKIDINKVSFKIGLSSGGIKKKHGVLRKSIDLDWPTDSDDSPESAKDGSQKSGREKSNDSGKSSTGSSKARGKTDSDIKKDSKETDCEQKPVESCTCVGKDKVVVYDPTSGCSNSKSAMTALSDSRKRLHSRWDQEDHKSKKFCAQQSDTVERVCDPDDDINDYADALLERDIPVKNLGAVSNKISDSILKSASSAPKASKTCGKPSINQKPSAEPEEVPSSQKEVKTEKVKSTLTDKPLEFLLFAKEMIMQKLQEEEGEVEEGEIVDTPTQSSQTDTIDSQETGSLTESSIDPSEQKTAQRSFSDPKCVLSKERKDKNIVSQSEKEVGSAGQSTTMLKTSSSPLSSVKEEAASRQQNTGGQSAWSGFDRKVCSFDQRQGSSERTVSSTSLPQKPKHTAEGSQMSFALDASSMAAVTEEEINKLKEIVCQLTSLPVKDASDKPSTSASANNRPSTSVSANKDQSVPTMGRDEQKARPISSQVKSTQDDRFEMQRSKSKRGGSGGRDWSLFLTSSRPSYKRLFTSTSEKRNYYGDVIEPPLYASSQESVQGQHVPHSTEESFPGPHAWSQFASDPKLNVKTKPGAAAVSPLSGVAAAQQAPFQCASSSGQKQSSEKSKTASEAGPSYFTSLPVAVLDSHLQHTSAVEKSSPVETGQSCSLPASSTRDSKIKTLKDFLLENFPGENPDSFVNLMEYKLTANMNTMSHKVKDNILSKVFKHLQQTHQVSSSTSAAPPSHSLAAPRPLLDEFAVDQIELELRLVEGCLGLLEATKAIQSMPDQDELDSNVQSLTNSLAQESRFCQDALTVVINDFNKAMADTRHGLRGRAHQRIPAELLLHDEQDQLYTKEGGFTVLIAGIPMKPFARLLQYKKDIEESLTKIGMAALAKQTFVVTQEKQRVQQIRSVRLQLLQTFSGAVSQGRLKKVTRVRDLYASSLHHLHQVLGEKSVVKMVFFRATFDAIENHLQILQAEMK